MPKPDLTPELGILESQLIETLQAGLHEWRPDLSYPQSYSDFQACVRGLLQMFEVKRLPLPRKLKYPCHHCNGMGYHKVEASEGVLTRNESCKECKTRGVIEL